MTQNSLTAHNITDLVDGDILNEQQMRFCMEYVIDNNATQAAIRAGYSEDNAASIASRLSRNVNIARAIKLYREKISDDCLLTAGDIVRKNMEIADRCMVAVPVLEYDFKEQKMMPTGEYQFDSKGAIAAWTLIAKLLGFIDTKTAAEGIGGFTLNIITYAVQMEKLKQKQAHTIEGSSVSQTVSQVTND